MENSGNLVIRGETSPWIPMTIAEQKVDALENQLTLEKTFELLNNPKLSFEGIDGHFSFENNLIKRELKLLQIKDGKALLFY